MMEVVALLAALVLFTVAAGCGLSLLQRHAQANPVDPGTHPVTWVQPSVPQPSVPQPSAPPQVTNTTTYHIDTVNVYQAAPLEQPVSVPAELRRIRPVIER